MDLRNLNEGAIFTPSGHLLIGMIFIGITFFCAHMLSEVKQSDLNLHRLNMKQISCLFVVFQKTTLNIF